MMKWFRGAGLVCVSAVVTACSVGPDYKRPPVDAAPVYKEQDGWKPTEPADAMTRGPWWHIFNDEVLNGLEDQIDVSNLTVKEEGAAVEQARALVREAQAGFWPTITASAGRTHEKSPSGSTTGSSIIRSLVGSA